MEAGPMENALSTSGRVEWHVEQEAWNAAVRLDV